MQPGTQLGHYEILSALGKGGMGEVWRATDQKLGREVAIKTLPEEFAKDEERLARFEREAKLLASLNDPNIAAIYGLEEHNGTRFLVLELVEGDTLAERLKRDAIPVEESLKLALQIAEALEAAHEKGVIHRDLKPANIKITPDGKIKVLDFGLAKAFAGDGSDVNLSQSPTLSMAATQQGVILGTAAYMSPEQASGSTSDRRADIWSFGVVLFEMLTGQQVFPGETVSHVLAGVLAKEPTWKTLPLNLHPRIRLLLERCLEKEAKDRYHDVADVRVDIQTVLADPDGAIVQPVAEAALPSKLPWIAAIVLAVITGVAVWSLTNRAPNEVRTLARFAIDMPPDGPVVTTYGWRVVTISPDGSRIAYASAPGGAASRQIYIRHIDELEATVLRGTEGGGSAPFFSPDGESIGFVGDTMGHTLKRVSSLGGPPTTIGTLDTQPRGMEWTTDGTILFSLRTRPGLLRIPVVGGDVEQLTTVDEEANEAQHEGASLLPDGDTVLFSIAYQSEEPQLARLSLSSREVTHLRINGNDPMYSPTGHIVYAVSDGTLRAVGFDLDRRELTSTNPVPVQDNVNTGIGGRTGNFGLAANGSLVYLQGTADVTSRLVWVDRHGAVEPVGDFPEAAYNQPRLSPDGRRALLGIGEPGIGDAERDIWVYELERGGRIPLTRDGVSLRSVWSTDGAEVAFTSARSGIDNIFVQPSDGSGEARKLTDSEYGSHVDAWSVDGTLSFHRHGSLPDRVDTDVLTISDDGGEEQVFLGGAFYEATAVFSPDGNWVAYRSNESGQDDIYITAYPGPGGRFPVSTDGGTQPVWARNGELFYRSLDGNTMMGVRVSTEATLDIGVPEVVFQGRYVLGPAGPRANYDVTAGGQQFLMISAGETDSVQNQINVVLNWFEELKELVPVP